VATLRSRDLHRRADWVEKDLPALIDTTDHASFYCEPSVSMPMPYGPTPTNRP